MCIYVDEGDWMPRQCTISRMEIWSSLLFPYFPLSAFAHCQHGLIRDKTEMAQGRVGSDTGVIRAVK